MLMKPPVMAGVAKNMFVSFIGRYNTHPVRELLKEGFEEKADFRFFDADDDWPTVMEGSVFSLCPRGFGHTSIRLYEAIHLESIPIYIWDQAYVLPYPDEIPWAQMAIILHTSEIDQLTERIASFDRGKARKLLHAWKSNFTLANTLKSIHERAGLPLLPNECHVLDK